MYINDLPTAFNNVCFTPFIHAYDLSLQTSCLNISLVNQLMSYFYLISEKLTAANALCLNKDKTRCIKFSLSNYTSENKVTFWV